MREFTFDLKAFITLRVKAETEEEARSWIDENIDGVDANLGCYPDGQPIVVEVSLDGFHDLMEIDGEAT